MDVELNTGCTRGKRSLLAPSANCFVVKNLEGEESELSECPESACHECLVHAVSPGHQQSLYSRQFLRGFQGQLAAVWSTSEGASFLQVSTTTKTSVGVYIYICTYNIHTHTRKSS